MGLAVRPPEGTYFALADIRPLGWDDDAAFCRHLVEAVGVAAIPNSAFSLDGRVRHLGALRVLQGRRDARRGAEAAREAEAPLSGTVDTIVLAVFGLVYLGMLLGEIPGLALDRTGVALLGALALVATERVTPAQAWAAVDVPTLALLFGLMVVSAQLRLGGFYTWVTRGSSTAEVSPAALLAALVAVAGALSAVLANDIVCLAMAPLLVEGCLRRRLDPVPFLLALACAANVGSAATLIGNPQNMLIGQTLQPAVRRLPAATRSCRRSLGLVAVWARPRPVRPRPLVRRDGPRAGAARGRDAVRPLADAEGPAGPQPCSSWASSSPPCRERCWRSPAPPCC